MLTYDSLLEQAKLRGMPLTKIRGILREYLQVLILKEIYRSSAGKKLFFTGGTYLRLVHNIRRFSEDLDFNTARLAKKEFESLLKKVSLELGRSGIYSAVRFQSWGNIYCARLIFPQIEKNYGAISKYSKKEGIIIKIEANRPRWRVKANAEVISGFGEFYPCVCTDVSQLFADKVDAFTKKDRARHLYDIMFMLSNKYPVDKRVLSGFGFKQGPSEVILKRLEKISKPDLKKQAEALRPFLFDEKEADLVAQAHTVLAGLVEKYKLK